MLLIASEKLVDAITNAEGITQYPVFLANNVCMPDLHQWVTIEVADIKNPKSSVYHVEIDAFEVIH
jgi:hypothetical protein